MADARRPGVPSAPIADAKHGDLMEALTEATIDDLLGIVTSRTDMHWEESLVELRSAVQSTHGDGRGTSKPPTPSRNISAKRGTHASSSSR